jgi:site-specific DNA recombinase
VRVIGYIRVSTEDQAESGLGLEAQTFALRQWSDRKGLELVGPFMDDCTGAFPPEKRKGLPEAIAELEAGDVLLVAKRDRLARDVMIAGMVEAAVRKTKARVVSAAGEGTDDDSPASVLMRGIFDLFAQYERLVIKARTKAALGAKSRKGERVGQLPYGAELAPDGVHLVNVPAELAVITRVEAWRHKGRSLRWIAAQLDRRGVPPKGGGPRWSHSSVQSILDRARETDRAEAKPQRPRA